MTINDAPERSKVFFLEDNQDVLDSTTSFFESHGIQTVKALTPVEAWSVLDTCHQAIRCAYIDKTLQRDQLAGMDFLQVARERFPAIDFVLLTAWNLTSEERERVAAQAITLIEKAATRPDELLARYYRPSSRPPFEEPDGIEWNDATEVAAFSGDLLFADRLREGTVALNDEKFVDRVSRLARRHRPQQDDASVWGDDLFESNDSVRGADHNVVGRSVRNWLEFWRENMKLSYQLASDHGNLASFVGPLLSVLAAVVGIAMVTSNRLLTALGAGLGVVLWFAFLAVFVTPARMWAATKSTARSRPLVVPEGEFRGLLAEHHSEALVTNIGGEAAIDVQMTWAASDVVSFDVVRVMKASDRVILSVTSHAALNPVSAFILAAQASRYGLAKRSATAGDTERAGITAMPKFVPACLTYRDARGVSIHSHDYVFAKDQKEEEVTGEICIVIRARTDSERFYGPRDT